MGECAIASENADSVKPTAETSNWSVAPTPLQTDGGGVDEDRGATVVFRAAASPYMTTDEAAAYLRKSVSWLLRVPDMAFLRGKPNLYAKSDLDAWVERHKHRPKVKA